MSKRKKTKNQSLASKIFPEFMPGQVERRMVRCGKANCRCARGQLHGPYFYHRTWSGETHQRRYIKLAAMPEAAQACQNYRQMQIDLREGRERYKQMMAYLRDLFRS